MTGRVILAAAIGLAACATARAAPPATETIVLLRHGEKPPAGLGQLDCQGLNRALALAGVLRAQFGRPAALFAPNPAVRKADHGIAYDYLRPLATIEPAAIAFGLPVDVSHATDAIAPLAQALDDPALRDKPVVVAWEHHLIPPLARLLLAAHGGAPDQVPAWRDGDFDGEYVITIRREGGHEQASFTRQREGLDGQARACPGAPPP